MGARAETLLTLALLLVCAGLVGVNLYLRLTVQTVPVAFEYPDVTVSVLGAVAVPGLGCTRCRGAPALRTRSRRLGA